MQRPVVLVTGVFDLLHREHILFLHKAQSLGGTLLIGIESDSRVRKIKGEGRPIQNEKERVQALVDLGIADNVFVLPETFSTADDHRKLLSEIRPDILAVSSHTAHLLEKRALMSEIGGQVIVVHEHNPCISTTISLLQKE